MTGVQHQVLLYVRSHPGCTVRDVAVECFGGTGATRTSHRARAWSALTKLEGLGRVTRTRPKVYTAGQGDRWTAEEEHPR